MKLNLTLGRGWLIAFLIASGWNAAGAQVDSQQAAHPQSAQKHKPFNEFAEQLAAEWMRADPVSATAQQYFSGAEQAALDRQLTAKDFAYGVPLSQSGRTEYIQRARRALDLLKGYPRSQLSPVERASAASLEWQLRDALRVAGLEERRFVFEQFGGLHVSLVNFLSQVHPMRTSADVDSYLARLGQLAPVLDEGVAEARLRARQGVVPPKFILQVTIDGLNRLLAPQPADNVLVTSLIERSAKITTLTDSQRAAARQAAEKVVRESVIPALDRVRALLSEQLPIATDEAGIHNLPNGSSPYALFLQSNTTTDLTPEQVHALGLQQVARIESEMDKLLRERGISFEKVNYYIEPLTKKKLTELIRKMGISPRDLLRTSEPVYRELGLAKGEFTDAEIISLMIENPDLIQRPIVERGDRAVLGRPTEKVKDLL